MDEIDIKTSEYNKGFEAGKNHQTPSPLTLEMFKRMEEKMDKLENKINEIALSIAALPEKLLDKCDARYAPKEVGDIINGLQLWLFRSGITIIILMAGIIAILIYALTKIN